MLQMLNVDVKRSNDPNLPNNHYIEHNHGEGSDDDMRRSQHTKYVKDDLVLPNVVNMNLNLKDNLMNNSADGFIPDVYEDKKDDNDPYKPKM